ncbi:MAG: phosphoribosyltransferase, partial [Phycisphaerales bacterium]
LSSSRPGYRPQLLLRAGKLPAGLAIRRRPWHRVHIVKFRNREDAGQQLATRLADLADQQPVVLALPRGGVVVGAQIAMTLGAPLDVLVVRKLGAPGRPELAIGAVTVSDSPHVVLNHDVVRALCVDEEYIEQETDRQLAEVRRRQEAYRRGREAVSIADQTVVVVDDGIATGATARAGLVALSRSNVAKLILAVPVAPSETIERMAEEVDEVVCLHTPMIFYAVGAFYTDFSQTTDEEVVALLERAGPKA